MSGTETRVIEMLIISRYRVLSNKGRRRKMPSSDVTPHIHFRFYSLSFYLVTLISCVRSSWTFTLDPVRYRGKTSIKKFLVGNKNVSSPLCHDYFTDSQSPVGKPKVHTLKFWQDLFGPSTQEKVFGSKTEGRSLWEVTSPMDRWLSLLSDLGNKSSEIRK